MQWKILLPDAEARWDNDKVVIEGNDGSKQEVSMTKEQFHFLAFVANVPVEILSPLYIEIDINKRRIYIGTEEHVREKKPPAASYPYSFMNLLHGYFSVIEEPCKGFIEYLLMQLSGTRFEKEITERPVKIVDVFKVIREPERYSYAEGELITKENFYIDSEYIEEEEEEEEEEVEVEEYITAIPFGKKSIAVAEQSHVFSILQIVKKTIIHYSKGAECEILEVRYAFPLP